jgi:hypothetical protein
LVDDLYAFGFQDSTNAPNIGPAFIVGAKEVAVDDQLAHPVADL